MAFYNAGLFIVLFLSLFMILLVGGRIGMRGAVPMLYLLAGISIWALCQLLHIFVIDPQAKYFWYQAKFLGILMVPPAFVTLAADISAREHLVKPIHLIGILLCSLLTLISIATDPWLHLFREKVDYVFAEQFILIQTVDGPAFWGFTAYSYALIGISVFLLVDKVRHSTGTVRKQSLLMLFGCLFPWFWNIVFLLLLDPVLPLDYTPVLMLVTETVFLITLFYYRMFNIVPFTKRAVFESLEDLVLVVDRAGVIQDMNPAAQDVFKTGVNSVGRNLFEYACCLEPPLQGTFEGIQGEYRGQRGSDIRDYLASVTPVVGRTGAHIGSMLVFKDITELTESRRALEHASQELAVQNDKKMQFVKQVNRNIRIPMNQILGFAEAFGQKALTESQQEAVDHLSISGGHLIQLINDITDYSKIETGKMELVQEPVQIFDLVRHVCRLYEYPAEQKGLRVKYTIAGDLPIVVLADSLRLTQVLSNIMGNAVKFTESGTVSLSVRKLPGSWMEVDISDTGIGISEKDIEKLFTPFQQAEEGTARKFGGTGLGLAIVKDLIERMGGDISIHSVVGSGTSFAIKLPCHESQLASPVYNLEQMGDYKSRSLTVGVATHDRIQQTLIRRFFRSWPHVICKTYNEFETAPGSDIAWDILLVHLEDYPGETLKSLVDGIYKRAGDKRPFIIGMTNDPDSVEWRTPAQGILDDCILMPLSFTDLNRMLRRRLIS